MEMREWSATLGSALPLPRKSALTVVRPIVSPGDQRPTGANKVLRSVNWVNSPMVITA
jgi:hypothetical protein